MTREEKVEQAAQQWAKDLTDLSGRNRLLYYKDLKAGTLDLANAAPAAVKTLITKGKVRLSRLFPSEQLANDAMQRTRAIHRKALGEFRGARCEHTLSCLENGYLGNAVPTTQRGRDRT